MNHDYFKRMIDESLAGALAAEQERSLREHLSTCAACAEYLSASNRVIAGLGGFSFEVTPELNARVVEALRLKAGLRGKGLRGTASGQTALTGQRRAMRGRVWAAFAAAMLMSLAGSALVYQVAERLAVPTHFHTAQVQAGVLVFWLLPSLCAALLLLAAPGRNRGMA